MPPPDLKWLAGEGFESETFNSSKRDTYWPCYKVGLQSNLLRVKVVHIPPLPLPCFFYYFIQFIYCTVDLLFFIFFFLWIPHYTFSKPLHCITCQLVYVFKTCNYLDHLYLCLPFWTSHTHTHTHVAFPFVCSQTPHIPHLNISCTVWFWFFKCVWCGKSMFHFHVSEIEW